MAKLTLSELNSNNNIAVNSSNAVPINRIVADDAIRKTRVDFQKYFSDVGRGISKGIAEIPSVAADLLRVTVDSMSGKGASKDELLNPQSWTYGLNPFNVVLDLDRKMRKTIFDNTDLDERIALWSDSKSNHFRRFVELGFPKQEDKISQFLEDVGAGSISLASAVTMGMIAGPIAPGIAFGLMAKAGTYKEALDMGKTYQEAQMLSNIHGLFEGGLEFWGIHRIISSNGGVILRGIKGMATEFIQEFSQSISEGTIKNISNIEKQAWADVLAQALYEGAIGAVLGGSSAISVASFQKHKIRRSMEKIGIPRQVAQQKTNEIFNKAGEAVFEEAKKVMSETFETQQNKIQTVMRAAAGEELTQDEMSVVENLYQELVDQEWAYKKKEQPQVKGVEDQQVDIMAESEDFDIYSKSKLIVDSIAQPELAGKPRGYPKEQRKFSDTEKDIIKSLIGELSSPGTGRLIRDSEGKVVGRVGSERPFEFLSFRKREKGESKKAYDLEKDRSGLATRELERTFNNVLEGKKLTNKQTQVVEKILEAAKVHQAFLQEDQDVREKIGIDEEEANRVFDMVEESIDQEEQIDQFNFEGLQEETLSPIQKKAVAVSKDIEKKINLLYQGREKQLDQRRIAIEKEMKLLEEKERTKSVQNKLDKLSKELESIYFQIADLEETALARFDREGILLGGKDLEQLRKIAFRRGEVALRKDLMAKMKAKRQEQSRRKKAIKTVLKQPKKPENIIDINYQNKIQDVLNKLGSSKKERRRALNSMSTEELETVAREIAEYKQKGREIFKSKKEQIKMASEILRAMLLKEIGSTPFASRFKGSVEEKKLKKPSVRKEYTLAFIRPLRFIREVFGKIGERMFYDSVDRSWTRKAVSMINRQQRIQESMKKNKGKFKSFEYHLGDSVEYNGQSYQVMEILAMYIYKKDAHAWQMVQQGNNITNEAADFLINVVDKEYKGFLSFADDIQQIVAEKYDDIRDVVKTYYNVDVDKVPVYFPLHLVAKNYADPDLYNSLESYHLNEQVLRKGGDVEYTSLNKKFIITRKEISEKFNDEVSLNFLHDAYNAIGNQEHLLAFAHLQKAFNKIIDDNNIRDAVKYNYSEKAWNDFVEYLNVNLNPHKMVYGARSKWVRRLRQNLAKVYLGFNVITGFKQIPSVLGVMKYSSLGQIAVSMGKILTSKQARDLIYKLDPSLKNRIITRDYAELMSVINDLPENDIKRALKVASQKLTREAFWMITQWDKLAVLSAYDAVYQHQRKNVSENEAKDLAHKAILETQPQGGIKDLPQLYRTNNEYARMVLMFTNQLNQYWNMSTSDLPMEIRNKEYGKAMTGVASQMLISALIYAASHGGTLPEDPEDFIEAIFGTFIGSIPLFGNLGLSIFKGYEPSISPAESLLSNVNRAYHEIQEEGFIAGVDEAMFLLAVFSGVPYSQAKRTLKGFMDLQKGTTSDIRRLLYSGTQLKK